MLSRKQDLEQQIQGKDKALVAEQIEEIADINVRMAEVLRAKIETEDEETIEQRLENRDKSLFEDTQEAGVEQVPFLILPLKMVCQQEYIQTKMAMQT